MIIIIKKIVGVITTIIYKTIVVVIMNIDYKDAHGSLY